MGDHEFVSIGSFRIYLSTAAVTIDSNPQVFCMGTKVDLGFPNEFADFRDRLSHLGIGFELSDLQPEAFYSPGLLEKQQGPSPCGSRLYLAAVYPHYFVQMVSLHLLRHASEVEKVS